MLNGIAKLDLTFRATLTMKQLVECGQVGVVVTAGAEASYEVTVK